MGGVRSATATRELVVEHEPSGLLVLRWPSGPLREDDWKRHLEVWGDAARRARPFVLLSDVSGTVTPDAKHRAEVVAFIERNRAALVRHQRGAALVVANALQRGAITAILWVTGTPIPVQVFTDFERARGWALTLLAP
jgi:hypothetical protein